MPPPSSGLRPATFWKSSESSFSYFANIVVARRHRGQGVGAHLMARYEQLCRRRGVSTILALVYDWNRDMHRVMRRKRYRNSGRLVEYIKKLQPPTGTPQ